MNDLPLLPRKVDDVLRRGAPRSATSASPTRLEAMGGAIVSLARPDAAFTIADAVLEGRIAPARGDDADGDAGPSTPAAWGLRRRRAAGSES